VTGNASHLLLTLRKIYNITVPPGFL